MAQSNPILGWILEKEIRSHFYLVLARMWMRWIHERREELFTRERVGSVLTGMGTTIPHTLRGAAGSLRRMLVVIRLVEEPECYESSRRRGEAEERPPRVMERSRQPNCALVSRLPIELLCKLVDDYLKDDDVVKLRATCWSLGGNDSPLPRVVVHKFRNVALGAPSHADANLWTCGRTPPLPFDAETITFRVAEYRDQGSGNRKGVLITALCAGATGSELGRTTMPFCIAPHETLGLRSAQLPPTAFALLPTDPKAAPRNALQGDRLVVMMHIGGLENAAAAHALYVRGLEVAIRGRGGICAPRHRAHVPSMHVAFRELTTKRFLSVSSSGEVVLEATDVVARDSMSTTHFDHRQHFALVVGASPFDEPCTILTFAGFLGVVMGHDRLASASPTFDEPAQRFVVRRISSFGPRSLSVVRISPIEFPDHALGIRLMDGVDAPLRASSPADESFLTAFVLEPLIWR